jgi:hypothetical protein
MKIPRPLVFNRATATKRAGCRPVTRMKVMVPEAADVLLVAEAEFRQNESQREIGGGRMLKDTTSV